MKPSRIAMATVGVGAALTAGAWTMSAAAIPLPADPITIPVVGSSQPVVADQGIPDPAAADTARAVAEAEARLAAINSQLEALVVQRASAASAAAAPPVARPTAAPPAAAPNPAAIPAAPIPAAPLPAAPTAAAPQTHTVTGASGSTSAVAGAAAEDHDSAEQDD